MSDTVINSNNYNKLAALKLSQASKKTDQADSTSTRDFSSLFQNAASTITNTLSGGNLEDIFKRAAAQYKIPESLLKAVAKVESGNDASAVSSCGAQGVMQLMPSTAASLGVQDPLNAEQNIMGGAKYLSQMLTRYNGNPQLALAAYNAGSGNVAKYGGIPPFKETQTYIARVMDYAGLDPSSSSSLLGSSSDSASSSNPLSALSSLFGSTDSSNPFSALSSLLGSSSSNQLSALSGLLGSSSSSDPSSMISSLLGTSSSTDALGVTSAANGGTLDPKDYASMLQIMIAKMQLSASQPLSSDLTDALSSDSSSSDSSSMNLI